MEAGNGTETLRLSERRRRDDHGFPAALYAIHSVAAVHFWTEIQARRSRLEERYLADGSSLP
jgi:hypothetical protein